MRSYRWSLRLQNAQIQHLGSKPAPGTVTHARSQWLQRAQSPLPPPREGGGGEWGGRLPAVLMALAPLEVLAQSRGGPPAPRCVTLSAAKAVYNAAGESVWEQTGLREKSAFFPLTGLLGFQPNLATAASQFTLGLWL